MTPKSYGKGYCGTVPSTQFSKGEDEEEGVSHYHCHQMFLIPLLVSLILILLEDREDIIQRNKNLDKAI